MSFKAYIAARPVTADAEGDFAKFAIHNCLPEPTTWVALAAWLDKRPAAERLVAGARKVWAEYTAIQRGAARDRPMR